MRVWDIPEKYLCRQHLLGQHREMHAIWRVVTEHRKGYSRHPEVVRWHPCPDALKNRHDQTAEEMARRGYKHNSPINYVGGPYTQDSRLCSAQEQVRLLLAKGCDCRVAGLLETASACSTDGDGIDYECRGEGVCCRTCDNFKTTKGVDIGYCAASITNYKLPRQIQLNVAKWQQAKCPSYIRKSDEELMAETLAGIWEKQEKI